MTIRRALAHPAHPAHEYIYVYIEERTDVGDGRGDADFDTRITLLGQLAGEELVQLGIENTVGDELATLGDSLGLC